MENNLYRQGSSGWTIGMRRSEEFEEADIWGSSSSIFQENKVVVSDSDSDSSRMRKTSSVIITKPLPSATRMIPPRSSSKISSNLESAMMTQHSAMMTQHSAPLNVPDWSNIYGAKSSKNFVRSNLESEEDEGIIPPHEWIAKRTVISSFSVCEGAGRTLKGRDLSRVRNAVLTKTGFLES